MMHTLEWFPENLERARWGEIAAVEAGGYTRQQADLVLVFPCPVLHGFSKFEIIAK